MYVCVLGIPICKFSKQMIKKYLDTEYLFIRGIFILRTLKIRYMPVFCLFTLGRHGNFTAGVTSEQTDLLCTVLALNIELLSIIVCAVL
jgi:hypothetical protein